jgi:hypothetical protein
LWFGLGFSQATNYAHTWASILYKHLNLATIPGYPNAIPKESHKWLPKFTENNVITPEERLEAIGVAIKDNDVEHEDVAMKLLAMSLDEDARQWYKGLPDNHLTSYEAFAKLFKERWTTKKDSECY